MLWFLWFCAVLNTSIGGNKVPRTGFSCDGRTTGYYADVQSGCQVYHMCDGLGRQFSYTCPNATLFQQRMLICDHWYMVNCSKSVDNYGANLRIGRKMPFVDDSETSRTPRPDLLAHHSQSEYDIIYRTGKSQFGTNLNLVGANTEKNSTGSTTDEPIYSLPSHWSTQYDQTITQKPKIYSSTKKPIHGNLKGKPLNTVTEIPINFKSAFKATTPVFPKTVDVTTVSPDSIGLVPPLPYQLMKDTENKPVVNFQSNFIATTPVYPLSVEINSEEPSQVGLVPPENGHENTPQLNLEPPSVDLNFNQSSRSQDIVQTVPTKFYQAPKYDPDYTEIKQEAPKKGEPYQLSSNEWADLRQQFSVPDYEFPLETGSRPSYDSGYSSFEAHAVPSQEK